MADDRYQDELAYQREQDALNNQRYDQEQQRTDQEITRENAWKKLQSGVVPTAAELALLGMSRADAQQLAQMMKMMLMGYYG